METAPTSIEVLLRPTLCQSDEPSDLRGSLSPTSVYSTWQSPGGHPSNYEPGATSPNFSDRANHDERTPYSVQKSSKIIGRSNASLVRKLRIRPIWRIWKNAERHTSDTCRFIVMFASKKAPRFLTALLGWNTNSPRSRWHVPYFWLWWRDWKIINSVLLSFNFSSWVNIQAYLGPKTYPSHFWDDPDIRPGLRPIILLDFCNLWLTDCLVL